MIIKKKERQPQRAIEARAQLKELIAVEMEQLPELLAQLDPDKRVNALIKLMGFVFPKVTSVDIEIGEPMDFDVFTHG